MKLSSKALACGQSPMRKFHPYAVAAAAAGKKIYHLNIGQPDIHTPDALYDAIHNFRTPVLAYAASPGIPELIEAIERYYRNIGVQLNESDILITTGGSEALQIAANCLLDDGDEVIVPEPFYPNYHTFITTAGGVIHPLHTKPEEGYFYADRARIEACITPKTKAHHDHQSRQPHRHVSHGGADENAARRGRGARSVSRGRRGLPRVYLRR